MWFFEGMLSLSPVNSVLGVLFFVVGLSLVFMMLAMIVSQKSRYESDKMISFECGFDPLSSSRIPFSLRFFLLALLFLVFDLEMILLFPYVISVGSCYLSVGISAKFWGFIFLMILVGGLFHELNEGTLDWEMDD
uniref:NADH dehydrogenase subunit 3 n=1 Tax=Tapes dorsatus TaxID=368939 RepID=UPI002036FD0E|nr:NADH dehydrogenase subunit 3 [Tapes dorsatus]YP_010555896.1 NADH dehydrogenase subunit 3 [Tapes conspersus]URH16442.1 NADH dehydrogenase subunit 3 [Tapes dorsatus]UYR95128.1 NADH dehydrogenase subunit 3 [Tapes conspersus]